MYDDDDDDDDDDDNDSFSVFDEEKLMTSCCSVLCYGRRTVEETKKRSGSISEAVIIEKIIHGIESRRVFVTLVARIIGFVA